MTDREALHTLNKHALLFQIAENNRQIPDASEGSIMEILNALEHFQGKRFMDWCCRDCVFKLVDDADRLRKELNLKFHTFPKQGE